MPNIKRINPIAIAQELSQSMPLTTLMFAASANPAGKEAELLRGDAGQVQFSAERSGLDGTDSKRTTFLTSKTREIADG